ncbi:tyrosine-type recombinase/integrase [Roseateles cellulosilyticus]|uniref:tyrosine-type recombinase/integrase n=1 Tax=Pelomonas cellulosilytica TaxID=2906762 RepID=UPI001F1C16E4
MVLSVDEVLSVLAKLQDEYQLLARLLYGTGLRITEALCLRVKDIDFAQRAIHVRQSKGGKDRVVMLPQTAASSAASRRNASIKSSLPPRARARVPLWLAAPRPLAGERPYRIAQAGFVSPLAAPHITTRRTSSARM